MKITKIGFLRKLIEKNPKFTTEKDEDPIVGNKKIVPDQIAYLVTINNPRAEDHSQGMQSAHLIVLLLVPKRS